jgi:hypothetical protein
MKGRQPVSIDYNGQRVDGHFEVDGDLIKVIAPSGKSIETQIGGWAPLDLAKMLLHRLQNPGTGDPTEPG